MTTDTRPIATVITYSDGTRINVTAIEDGQWVTRTYKTRTRAAAAKFCRDINARAPRVA